MRVGWKAGPCATGFAVKEKTASCILLLSCTRGQCSFSCLQAYVNFDHVYIKITAIETLMRPPKGQCQKCSLGEVKNSQYLFFSTIYTCLIKVSVLQGTHCTGKTGKSYKFSDSEDKRYFDFLLQKFPILF